MLRRSALSRVLAVQPLFSLVLVLAAAALADPTIPRHQALTVPSYCEVEILILQESVNCLQSKIDWLEARPDEPVGFRALEDSINRRQVVWQDSLLLEYNTDLRRLAVFGSIWHGEIDAYLQSHREAANRLSGVRTVHQEKAAYFEGLSEAYQAAAGSADTTKRTPGR